jgi:hypothetical protein
MSIRVELTAFRIGIGRGSLDPRYGSEKGLGRAFAGYLSRAEV